LAGWLRHRQQTPLDSLLSIDICQEKPLERYFSIVAHNSAWRRLVAAGTVKEAVEVLRTEGLVHTVIGRGIFVR
jgi:hypothetical protein